MPAATTDVLLADGSTARLRPLVAADADDLVAFHEGLSLQSTSSRYFSPHPQLTQSDLDRVLSHDPDNLSVVADRAEKIIALAEYHRPQGSDEAEVAFVVSDAFQGRGLGTILLDHLATQARPNGIRRFTADTLVANRPMLDVFHSAGFVTSSSLDHGVVRVVLDIAPSAASVAAADERDLFATARSMARLLQPRSVAVIGASRKPGSIGHALVTALLAGRFQGPIYPVNPQARAISSIPAWPSVKDIPGPVDLAVVAVPAAAVIDVVDQCGRAGVGGLVIVSSGFAEDRGDGGASQDEVTRLAHSYGMRLVGPNCFGVVNTDPAISMNATFAPEPPPAGRIGFASQSGGLGIAILGEARERGIGISSFVSMGNKADVSGNDVLAWWSNDSATKVGLLYLESFGNPRKFSRLARKIGRDKPLVAVKGGRSTAGAAAAASHTAAMASSDRAVEALFKQAGVVRVETVEELFDVAEILANQPIPSGRRVGIVTNAGGPGVLAADACGRYGLEVPALSSALGSSLDSLQSGIANVHNPVDLAASASPEAYEGATRLLLESGEVDAILVIFTPPVVTRSAAVAEGVLAGVNAAVSSGHELPVLATFFGAKAGRDLLGFGNRPIPCYTYPETAIRALSHAVSYGEWRRQPDPIAAEMSGVDANKARQCLANRDAAGWLSPAAVMSTLQAYGIPTVPTIEVSDEAEVVAAARSLGGRLVLKVTGPSLVHKSDVGGVHLDLDGELGAIAAFNESKRDLGPAMTGAVVQPMFGSGVELIAGAVQDPQFGPIVLFGLGGTAAELLADYQTALAPLAASEARDLVLGTRAARLLTGYRGSAPVDLDGVIDVVCRLSKLVDDIPEIAELDCNPLIATPEGVVVVDARLRVSVELPSCPVLTSGVAVGAPLDGVDSGFGPAAHA